MGRLDLPDKRRDEDADTTRRGGMRRGEFRRLAESISPEKLIDMAEASFVVANALDLLANGKQSIDHRTLVNLAAVLRAGLR